MIKQKRWLKYKEQRILIQEIRKRIRVNSNQGKYKEIR